MPATWHDAEFYVRQALACPQDGLIVELGVGTARVAVEVAKAGRPVVGVDLSPEMLRRAKRQVEAAGVADQVTLVLGDFIKWTPAAPADLIYCPYHTVSHVLLASDRKAMFENIWSSLKPGGRFAFCIYGPAFDKRIVHGPGSNLEHLPFAQVGKFDNGGAIAQVEHRTIFDPETRICYSDVRSKLFKGDTIIEQRGWTLALAAPTQLEIQSLADEIGFEVAFLSGDFTKETEPSEEQIWVLKKAHGSSASDVADR